VRALIQPSAVRRQGKSNSWVPAVSMTANSGSSSKGALDIGIHSIDGVCASLHLAKHQQCLVRPDALDAAGLFPLSDDHLRRRIGERAGEEQDVAAAPGL